jgi:hypothetical protein
MAKKPHSRNDFGYRVFHDSTWAMTMHEGLSKVKGPFDKHEHPRKPVPVLKRAKDAARAKVRKLCAGEQGSFSHIRKALRAADSTLKGNALSTLTNEIFYGEKRLRAVITSLAAKYHPKP